MGYLHSAFEGLLSLKPLFLLFYNNSQQKSLIGYSGARGVEVQNFAGEGEDERTTRSAGQVGLSLPLITPKASCSTYKADQESLYIDKNIHSRKIFLQISKSLSAGYWGFGLNHIVGNMDMRPVFSSAVPISKSS